MEIRKADVSEIEALVANRMKFIKGNHNSEIEITKDFELDTYNYLKAHMEDDSMSAWIVVENGAIVASVMVCYYQLLPLMSNKSGKTGYVLNVYTLPDYRKRGLATKLLNQIIQESKARNVGKLVLTASDMGRPVYQKLGFEVLSSEMAYKIL